MVRHFRYSGLREFSLEIRKWDGITCDTRESSCTIVRFKRLHNEGDELGHLALLPQLQQEIKAQK